MTGTLLPPDVNAAAANSSFRGTADDNAANSVRQKGESPSEQDDSSDIVIGDLGVNDGDDHASDDSEYANDSSSLPLFNAQNGEDSEEIGDLGVNDGDDHASDDTE